MKILLFTIIIIKTIPLTHFHYIYVYFFNRFAPTLWQKFLVKYLEYRCDDKLHEFLALNLHNLLVKYPSLPVNGLVGIHTYIYICMYGIYVYTILMHANIHTYIYTYIYIYIHTCKHTYIHRPFN